jgi:hypothetical protein
VKSAEHKTKKATQNSNTKAQIDRRATTETDELTLDLQCLGRNAKERRKT